MLSFPSKKTREAIGVYTSGSDEDHKIIRNDYRGLVNMKEKPNLKAQRKSVGYIPGFEKDQAN